MTIRFIATMLLLGIVSACSEKTRSLGTDQLDGANPDLYARVVNSHMHAAYLGMDDREYLADVLAEMDENNIEIAVLHINEPSDIDDWIKAAPGRFLAGPAFPCVKTGRNGHSSCSWDEGNWPSIAWLRENYENGTFAVMGEMTFVYAGISPSDPKMEQYWELAARLDIPVMVHINRGPPAETPSRPVGCCPKFDADLGNPELLRPVLEKHPHLRISLQHAGFPSLPELGDIDYIDETFALLRDYAGVYVDMTALNSVPPAFVHEAAVKQFLDRGYIDRIMMGTDNWDAAAIISRYQGFDFLSQEQKHGILYGNAARFFEIEPKR